MGLKENLVGVGSLRPVVASGVLVRGRVMKKIRNEEVKKVLPPLPHFLLQGECAHGGVRSEDIHFVPRRKRELSAPSYAYGVPSRLFRPNGP